MTNDQREWGVFIKEDAEKHVAPIDDLLSHTLNGVVCWCKPHIDDGIIVHKSADMREEASHD